MPRRALHDFTARLTSEVAHRRPFVCLITDDAELRRLNKQFRGKNEATDVLSFPSADHERLGEIAISYDRAREQAAALGHRTEDEIRILMLHGLLHLLGMDHETDRGEMARIEARWRRRLGLPAGLIERALAC